MSGELCCFQICFPCRDYSRDESKHNFIREPSLDRVSGVNNVAPRLLGPDKIPVNQPIYSNEPVAYIKLTAFTGFPNYLEPSIRIFRVRPRQGNKPDLPAVHNKGHQREARHAAPALGSGEPAVRDDHLSNYI